MPKVQSSSVPVIYMKDGKKYEGHYTTLRQSQDLWIEILLGRIPTTEEIDVTMQLFQPDGKRLVYANDVDLADLDKLSQKGVKAIDQGFMCVEVDMSNYKKSQ